jgi:hypothetical protein
LVLVGFATDEAIAQVLGRSELLPGADVAISVIAPKPTE